MTGFRVFDISEDNFDDLIFDYQLEETSALQHLLNNKTSVSIDDLRRVALWKMNRVLNVPDHLLTKLGALAVKHDLTHRDAFSKTLIEELVKSDGIGYPMASAILKFLRPDIFPIIDVRAYRALNGERIYQAKYSYELYMVYIDKLLEIANKKDLPLNKIDEYLYAFDKKHNVKINQPK